MCTYASCVYVHVRMYVMRICVYTYMRMCVHVHTMLRVHVSSNIAL